MKFKRADEMENYITMRAMHYAYVFLILALSAWILIVTIREGQIPLIPFIIETMSGIIFWGSRIYLTKKMAGTSDEE